MAGHGACMSGDGKVGGTVRRRQQQRRGWRAVTYLNKVLQKSMAGSKKLPRTAGEEVAAHPVVGAFGFKVVGGASMREDMDKEEAARLQKERYFFQQQLIVLHVLHHLDRHNAVERAEVLVVDLHRCDIARFDSDVAQAELGSSGFNVNFLRGRV